MTSSLTDTTRPGADGYPDLLIQFVESIFQEAFGNTATPDWQELLSLGASAGSTEEAIGRVAMAAWEKAGGLLERPELVSPNLQPPVVEASVVAPRVAPPAVEVPTLDVPVVGTPATSLSAPVVPTVEAPVPSPAEETLTRTEFAPAPARISMRRRRMATVFTWVRNVGAVLLLFAAWELWGTAIAEHHAQATLAVEFRHARSLSPRPASSHPVPTLIAAAAQLASPPDGSVVAELEIPAIKLSQYVVSGTDDAALAKGPGHYLGTSVPGQAGNVAIEGHRTTHGAPFYDISSLVVGDRIYLSTLSGERLDYMVAQAPFAVAPQDVAVLNDFGDNRLTLTTCNPPFSAAQRLIVVAKLTLPGPTTAPRAAVQRHHVTVVGVATTSWHWKSLPVVIVAALLLLGLGLFHLRLVAVYGGFGRWLVLTPIWIGGLYLLFSGLTSLIPPSV